MWAFTKGNANVTMDVRSITDLAKHSASCHQRREVDHLRVQRQGIGLECESRTLSPTGRLMQRKARFLVTALFAALTACSASDSSTGPEPLVKRRDTTMDCQMTATQCGVIQSGINYLKQHLNPDCRMAGIAAQNRYDSPSGAGFVNMPQESNYDMGVLQTPFPSNGYTQVYPKFWNSTDQSPPVTGSLIAHEEIHHLGGGDVGAYALQFACLNPQA